MKERFISVEGPEGVGKSTMIKHIIQVMKELDLNVIATREPGGTPLGEELRSILLNSSSQITDVAEAFILNAGRHQHIRDVIEPQLNQNGWVVTDRFIDATYAYQGGGRGVSIDVLNTIHKLSVGSFIPYKTILLDAPIELCFERIKERKNLDRFEMEQKDFFHRVRNLYLERSKNEPERFIILDASQPIQHVKNDLTAVIQNLVSVDCSI